MANTIKKLIDASDLEKVYNLLLEKNTNSYSKDGSVTIGEIRALYGAACVNLLIKPNNEPSKDFAIYVIDSQSGDNVSLLNLNYEKPEDGLKQWGCIDGSELPEGYYDINSIKHSEFLGLGNTPWTVLSNMNIVIDETCKFSSEEVLANILWEITLYGFDEKAVMDFFEDLNKSILQK